MLRTTAHAADAAGSLLHLIGQDTRLRRVAATCGGEYEGPCPRCGGTNRFRVQPYAQPKPRWTCRQCLGTERWSDAPGYVMWRDGLQYTEALAALGLSHDRRQHASVPRAPDDSQPPPYAWQIAATRFLQATQRALWSSPLGDQARAYLHRRGLTDTTIRSAELGYNAAERYSPFAHWGLPEHKQRPGIWLPRGIVIPWCVGGDVWKLAIRRPVETSKYITVTGSSNVLYNVDALRPGCAAVLVEGPFDALAVEQEVKDIVTAVACGTTGARCMRWITRLALCSEISIALDNEEQHNADVARAVTFWLDVLQPRAHRWRPYLNDAAAMLEHGMSLHAWVEAGLNTRRYVEQHNHATSTYISQ